MPNLKAASSSEQTFRVCKEGAKGERKNLGSMGDGIGLLRCELISARGSEFA